MFFCVVTIWWCHLQIILVLDLEANTSVVENTTTPVFDDSNIQFEIKNYTVINHNGSAPNSYSLRIRIKGYKWRNQFTDVSSAESQALLKEKILPLLYKNLNLVPDEINEVKLLKLFRGRRSELLAVDSMAQPLAADELIFQFNLSKIKLVWMSFGTCQMSVIKFWTFFKNAFFLD